MTSIIIPTFGKPIYLQKSIESVLSQTYKDWELIIVDDNDPNTIFRIQTEKIVLSFSKDKRISYIKHPFNKNGAAARNTGIAAAKGEYISFLDSDDEYMPTRIEKCLKTLENSDRKIAGIFTGCEFKRGGKTFNKYKSVKSGNYLVQTLAGKFMFCTGSNLFIRKSVIKELYGFDEAFLRHQDYEFLVRLFEKYSLIAIPEILVVKNNENFNVPDVKKMIAIKQQYLAKYKYIINGLAVKEQNYIYHCHCVSIAELALTQKCNSIANDYYRKSKQYGLLSFRDSIRKMGFYFLSIIK